MNKKKLFRWIKVFVLVYCVIGIAVYYGQDWLLFRSANVGASSEWKFPKPFASLTLHYDQNTDLNVMKFGATDRPADSLAKGVVLYFPDNRENIFAHVAVAAQPTAGGFECWIMDYPGFGKSKGSHSEKDLYTYALVFYKLARSRWKPAQIRIMGTGMGAAIAAQLASIRDCQQLELRDAWYSLDARWRRFLFLYPLGMMLHYHFPTHQYLPQVTAPVKMVDCDGSLKSFLKQGDQFIP
jgi:alpha-beta hydrolase superfamily lysophospholipase